MFSITSFSELMQCNKTVNKPNNRNYWNFTTHERITKLSFSIRGGTGWWLMEPGRLITCYKNSKSLCQTWKKHFDVSIKSHNLSLIHTLLPDSLKHSSLSKRKTWDGDLGLAWSYGISKMLNIIFYLTFWKASERQRYVAHAGTEAGARWALPTPPIPPNHQHKEMGRFIPYWL